MRELSFDECELVAGAGPISDFFQAAKEWIKDVMNEAKDDVVDIFNAASGVLDSAMPDYSAGGGGEAYYCPQGTSYQEAGTGGAGCYSTDPAPAEPLGPDLRGPL
jgi:hypothetical protein